MKDTVTIVSEAQITPVPFSVLDVVWPEVVGYIEDAAATTNGKYKAQDIYDDIQRGFMYCGLSWRMMLLSVH